ncbi:MAG: hypothetical protein RLZZ37_583 [Actinomycetota bacterium]
MIISSGAITLAACSNTGINFAEPSFEEILTQEFITRGNSLVDLYFAGINQERSYRTQLIQLRDHHLTHLTLWTKAQTATPNPSPTGLQVASIKQLILAEEEHFNFCISNITKTNDQQILQNIGQIAASINQHIYWLKKMITPVALPDNAQFEGSDVGDN